VEISLISLAKEVTGQMTYR